MVITLILLIAIAVFMAFFIGKNLNNVCTFWLFKSFTNLPVSILVLLAFAAGICIALLFVLIFKIKSSSKEATKAELEEAKEKLHKKMKENEVAVAKHAKKNKKNKNDPDATIEAEVLK